MYWSLTCIIKALLPTQAAALNFMANFIAFIIPSVTVKSSNPMYGWWGIIMGLWHSYGHPTCLTSSLAQRSNCPLGKAAVFVPRKWVPEKPTQNDPALSPYVPRLASWVPCQDASKVRKIRKICPFCVDFWFSFQPKWCLFCKVSMDCFCDPRLVRVFKIATIIPAKKTQLNASMH